MAASRHRMIRLGARLSKFGLVIIALCIGREAFLDFFYIRSNDRLAALGAAFLLLVAFLLILRSMARTSPHQAPIAAVHYTAAVAPVRVRR